MAKQRTAHLVILFVFLTVALGFGIWSIGYAVRECGLWKAILMGDGAFFAAITGMCG